MRIAHFTLATRDVLRSSRFFQAVFGWRPIDHPVNIGRDASWLEISDGQQVHLLETPDFEPSAFEREFGRHIALYCPRERIPELKRRLVEQGAELIEPLRDTTYERFFFCDPNGYVFEVIEDPQPGC